MKRGGRRRGEPSGTRERERKRGEGRWEELQGCERRQREVKGEKERECSSRISAANDESNKTWMDCRLGQIGRPFNWEFDEFMDFLICHYGRPFRNSLSCLAPPFVLSIAE